MDNSLHGKNKGWSSVKNFINYQQNTPNLIYNYKPSYSVDEAAEQLSRGETALLWKQKHTNNQPLTITYSFPDWTEHSDREYQSLYSYSRYPAPEGLTADQQQKAILSLQAWQDVTNIKLVKVDSTEKAMLTFGNYHGAANDGLTTFDRIDRIDSKIWFNTDKHDNLRPTQENNGSKTYSHEIGHALGLNHPGDYNSLQGGYQYKAPYKEDSLQYSVMSYWDGKNTGADHHYKEVAGFYIYDKTYSPAAPLMHDIAAIQKIHGVNTTTRTGDTIYGFNSNSDRDFYTLTDSKQKAVFCVWDAGGNDTLDFSGYYQNQRISLKEASFSDVGSFKANVSIAQGAIIENAIGGSGDDVIVGNDTNNTIEGGKGNDIIYGGKGKDILWGGNRNDIVLSKKTDDQPTIEIDDTKINNAIDDDKPLKDYSVNEVSNTGCTTPPCGGYNVNPYCPWTNPGCNNNGYSTTYYSMPIFNGFTYGSDWPGQYYGNTIAYNAFYPNQQGYCNNNYYGYCQQQQKLSWQPTSANLIIDNYSGNDINPYYHDKKPQKIGNGSGKDTFVFSSIKDSPYDNPDKIMDFETGIDLIDLSAIRLNSYSTSNPKLYFVDYFTKQVGDMMLTYNEESNLSRLFIDGNGDAIPDFELHILGVVEQSDLILA